MLQLEKKQLKEEVKTKLLVSTALGFAISAILSSGFLVTSAI